MQPSIVKIFCGLQRKSVWTHQLILLGFGCSKVSRVGDLLVHVGILVKSNIVAFGVLRVNCIQSNLTNGDTLFVCDDLSIGYKSLSILSR